jgi:hypothetical protein
MLTSNESYTDSNERELLAGKETLLSTNLENTSITLHFDNYNASLVSQKGSSKLRLHKHAVQIDDFCIENGLQVKFVNIPRDLNQVADSLSRIVDFEDYSVCDSFFKIITEKIRIKPNIDRFADNFNCKVKNFNSKYFCLGSAGVDAFNYDWGKPHVNWIFPPPRLLIKCLNHLESSKGFGIIVTPEWKGSDFYPYFHAKKYTKKCKEFLRFNGKNAFKAGSDKSSHFGPNFNAAVNVWIFDFT